jgi:hypothetical protein
VYLFLFSSSCVVYLFLFSSSCVVSFSGLSNFDCPFGFVDTGRIVDH